MQYNITNDHDEKTSPKPYIQNRSNWCWAAAAKIVGMHYKSIKPRYQFTIKKSIGLTSELRQQGFVSQEEMRDGVLTFNQEGLHEPYERDGKYFIDAWQRAIVMNSNAVMRGKDENFVADDDTKIRALKYVISGNTQSFGLQVINLGFYNDEVSLLDRYHNEIETAFATDRWMIGNYLSELTQKPHSVVLMTDKSGKIRLFDPWDGFNDIYSLDQIFKTGFLTNLGQGIIRWIQYVR